MKTLSTVWTLSWDTAEGLNCCAFGSESDWFDYFSNIINSSIQDIEDPQADEIRVMLEKGEIGIAYEIWQESFKPELDTYNWDSQLISLTVSDLKIPE